MFDDLVQVADGSVMETLGEPVTIIRQTNSQRLQGVRVVIDRGVPLDQGEAATLGYTVSYSESVAGWLAQGDHMLTCRGERFVVSRRLGSDDNLTTRILLKQ